MVNWYIAKADILADVWHFLIIVSPDEFFCVANVSEARLLFDGFKSLISNYAALYVVGRYVIFISYSLCSVCKISATLSLFEKKLIPSPDTLLVGYSVY